MRPLTLRVAGLRSYRSERTLDFTGRSLLAILGDTGSGKSSLLEALYGALYGQSTWDARGLGALIADGVKTLQLELTFTARGKTYVVSRSSSRENYPPAKHLLRCLDDGEVLDGQSNVNRRIAQVVGLTDKEFLRVVILPQGRFAELLQGTAGDRTPVLRGILGLGVLTRVRDIADSQATALSDAVEPLTAARARLYPNPAQVAEQAESDVAAHTTRCEQLGAAVAAIDALTGAAAAVEHALPAVDASLTRAAAVDLSPVLATLADIDAAAAELDAEADQLSQLRATHQKAADEADQELEAAAQRGITAAGLALAGAAVDSLVEQLPELRRDAAEQQQVAGQLAAAAGELDASAAAVTAAQAAAADARTDAGALEAAARTAELAERDAQRALTEIGQLTEQADRQSELIGPALVALAAAAAALAAAREQLAATTAAEQQARNALAELHAANAAAHVAAGHQPGQPCPVCARALPDDFEAPPVVGEQELTGQLTQAGAAVAAATKGERLADKQVSAAIDTVLTPVTALALATADIAARTAAAFSPAGPSGASADAAPVDAPALREAARQLLEDAVTAATAAGGAAGGTAAGTARAGRKRTAAAAAVDPDALAAELRALAAAAGPQTAAGPTGKQRQALLEQLTAARTNAAAAFEQARDRCQELDTAAATAAAQLTAARTQLERDQQAHQSAADRLGKAADRLATQLAAVPSALTAPLTAALAAAETIDGHALLTGPELTDQAITTTRDLLAEHTRRLHAWTTAAQNARTSISDVDRNVLALVEQRRSRIDEPSTQARTAIERARSTTAELSAVLPALETAYDQLCAVNAALPARPTGAFDDPDSPAPASLSEDCQRTADRLAVTVQAATGTGAAARAALTGADEHIAVTVASTGTASVQQLRDTFAELSHQLREATTRRDRALSQAPVAAGLDAGLTGLRGRLAVLRAVKDVMTASQFPDFVIAQRQQALLRIASTLLAKLTRDAYGFGPDFSIVDRRTGQGRHAKTLSGGETFLASMALALALVEISNRSGGQLDALFLDEGFGSLDASILGDALDVLREQAVGGRLVGVISHLHAVAAEVEDVLVVTKAVEGSDFRWLDDDERDQYLLDEQAAGLLG